MVTTSLMFKVKLYSSSASVKVDCLVFQDGWKVLLSKLTGYEVLIHVVILMCRNYNSFQPMQSD